MTALAIAISPLAGHTKIVYAGEQNPPLNVPDKMSEHRDAGFNGTPKGKHEIVEARTKSSKRFWNPDGTFTLEVYPSPVHYRNEKTGKWEEIDSTLYAGNDGKIRNKANHFSVELQQKANGGMVKLSKGDAAFLFKPVFATSSEAKVQGSTLTYEEAIPNVDLIYDVIPDGLKETLVLKTADVPNKYSFEFGENNLTHKENSNGSIDFYQAGKKEPVFSLAAPFMIDQQGEKSGKARYEIRKETNGKMMLDLVIDEEWLQDQDRAFPVLLDPTVQHSPDVQDVLIESTYPNSNYVGLANNSVGGFANGADRILVWYDLPSLPSGAQITSATAKFYNSSISNAAQSPVIEVHRIMNDWSHLNVTWGTQPSTGGIDATYKATNTTVPSAWNFNVTNLVQDWYSGTVSNHGIMLKYADELLAYRGVTSSYDSSKPTQRPSLTVNYKVDGLGYMPTWTFEGPVNMGNRNLFLTYMDVNFPGRNVPLMFTRNYNSRTPAGTKGAFGHGWTSQHDISVKIPTSGTARLVSAEGTVHHFTRDENGVFKMPEGMFGTFELNGNTAVYTDVDGTKQTFTDLDPLNKYSYFNGKLTRIEDAKGNKLTYFYSGEMLSGIQDDAGHKVSFVYSNGQLKSATDPVGRVWNYYYDTNGNLTKVVYPDSTFVEYRYNDQQKLSTVVSPKGTKTHYVYTSDNSLHAINPTNLVTNGSFEVDTNGLNMPDHFLYSTGQQGTAGRDTASNSEYGKQSFKINVSSSNSLYWSVYLSDPIKVSPSRNYNLSAMIKAVQNSGTLTSVVSVLAYDAAGTYLGEFGRSAKTGSFDWQRVSNRMGIGTITALPAGTENVYVKIASTVSGGSGSTWIDMVQLEENTTATDPVVGDQYTASAANMQTARYDGDGRKTLYTYNTDQNITKRQVDPTYSNVSESYNWADNQLIGKTDGNGNTWSFVNDPNHGKLKESTNPEGNKESFLYDSQSNLMEYTNLKGATSRMTYDVERNMVTARDPFLTSSATEFDEHGHPVKKTNLLGWTDNLIDNSSFENGLASDGMPINFTEFENAAGLVDLHTSGAFGHASLKITAAEGDNVTRTSVVSDAVEFEPGTDYLLSGYLKVTRGMFDGLHSTYLMIAAYGSDGAYLGSVGSLDIVGATDWRRWSHVVKAGEFPDGTAQIRVQFKVNNSTGKGISYFDAIQLQKHPVDTAYNMVDNSSFERADSYTATWPKLWGRPSNGNSGWSAANFYGGDRSVWMENVTDYTGIAYQSFIPYDASQTYNLTAFVKTKGLTANVAHIKIEHYDSNKNLIGQTSSASVGGTQGWMRLGTELPQGQATTGTVYIRPVLSSGPAAGTVYFDNIRLQTGAITTTFGYDPAGTRMETVTDPAGNTTTFQYDAAGNVTSTTNALHQTITNAYDTMDRLTSTLSPDGNVKKVFGYDKNGQLISIKTKNSGETVVYSSTTIGYNPQGLKSYVIDPLQRRTSYEYSASGLLTEVRSHNSAKSVSYTYDTTGRLADIFLGGVKRYNYTLDGNGNLLTVKDQVTGRSWTSGFDKMDRLTSWGDGSFTINYTPDSMGNTTSYSLKKGLTLLEDESIVYNNLNQPMSMTIGERTANFLFHENGKISRLENGNHSVQFSDYTESGLVKKWENLDLTGDVITSESYEYDAVGRVKSIADHKSGNVNSYAYDNKGQLVSETLSNGSRLEYTYDELGNRKQMQEKNTSGTIVKTTSYQVDAASQLLQVDGTAWAYDESGNVTSNGRYKFEWDDANRLTKVTDQVTQAVVATYKYDHLNRRIQKTENNVVTNFLYNGNSNHVVAEYGSDGVMDKYFVWSPTGQLLAVKDCNSNITYSVVRNGHGDITALTDHTGKIVVSYEYDAWGNLINSVGDLSLNPYRYANYRYDDITGLYYLIGRYYDPKVGRFLTPDPIFEEPQYGYASNNPLSYVDMNGYMERHTTDDAVASKENSKDSGSNQSEQVPTKNGVITITDMGKSVLTNTQQFFEENYATIAVATAVTTYREVVVEKKVNDAQRKVADSMRNNSAGSIPPRVKRFDLTGAIQRGGMKGLGWGIALELGKETYDVIVVPAYQRGGASEVYEVFYVNPWLDLEYQYNWFSNMN